MEWGRNAYSVKGSQLVPAAASGVGAGESELPHPHRSMDIRHAHTQNPSMPLFKGFEGWHARKATSLDDQQPYILLALPPTPSLTPQLTFASLCHTPCVLEQTRSTN